MQRIQSLIELQHIHLAVANQGRDECFIEAASSADTLQLKTRGVGANVRIETAATGLHEFRRHECVIREVVSFAQGGSAITDD